MTEPDARTPTSNGDTPEPTDEPLGTFKPSADDADTPPVNEGHAVTSRMSWDPVTDTGGAPRPEPPTSESGSGFQFDLGRALSRLGGDPPVGDRTVPDDDSEIVPDPTADPLPTRQRSTDSLPTRQPAAEPVDPLPTHQPAAEPVDPLPTRQPAAEPVFDPSQTRQPAAEPVFDPSQTRQPAAEPVFDPLPTRQPAAEPVAPAPVARQGDDAAAARTQPEVPTAPVSRHTMPGRSVFDEQAAAPALPDAPSAAPPPATAPTLPSVPVAASSGMPTLPAATPAAPPPVAAPIETAPSTPDINALRSAQLRANRDQRKGKMFGRSVLAFLIIGALIAGALLFGRSYLFSTDWDPALTPIVDEIQETRGMEFDQTVPLVVQPLEEYRATVLTATVGNAWPDRIPEWRALGLAGPESGAESAGTQLAALRPAVYDAASDTIYQLADVPAETLAPHLELALELAFARQQGASGDAGTDTNGFTGVSSQREITERSIDAVLVSGFELAPGDLDGLPLPIAYEISAIDALGNPLLAAARIEPSGLRPGTEYPEAVYGLLDDGPANAASGLLQPGERALADPVALGVDDWSLVWGTRLPASTVARLGEIVSADSYRPIDRAGQTCFVAVFQTGSEADGSTLFSALLSWAAGAPAESQANAAQLGATRVQLDACDPGAAAATPDTGSVDRLIDRQIDRLAV